MITLFIINKKVPFHYSIIIGKWNSYIMAFANGNIIGVMSFNRFLNIIIIWLINSISKKVCNQLNSVIH